VAILQDVLAPDLAVVFCGTAPGRVSAEAKAYYAHPRNRFWSILHETGLIAGVGPLAPARYLDVLAHGIGLTDLNKTEFGNDNQLSHGHFDKAGLETKIARFQPAILAFTSQTGGRVFCGPRTQLGWQERAIGHTRIYVLPSTSPTAQWRWNDTRHHWHVLAESVKAEMSKSPKRPRVLKGAAG
jgi:TDG/mug DNA glycosylase family protein